MAEAMNGKNSLVRERKESISKRWVGVGRRTYSDNRQTIGSGRTAQTGRKGRRVSREGVTKMTKATMTTSTRKALPRGRSITFLG